MSILDLFPSLPSSSKRAVDAAEVHTLNGTNTQYSAGSDIIHRWPKYKKHDDSLWRTWGTHQLSFNPAAAAASDPTSMKIHAPWSVRTQIHFVKITYFVNRTPFCSIAWVVVQGQMWVWEQGSLISLVVWENWVLRPFCTNGNICEVFVLKQASLCDFLMV